MPNPHLKKKKKRPKLERRPSGLGSGVKEAITGVSSEEIAFCQPLTASLLPAHHEVSSSSLAYASTVPVCFTAAWRQCSQPATDWKLKPWTERNLPSFRLCFCFQCLVLSLGTLSEGKLTSMKHITVHPRGLSYSYCAYGKQHYAIIYYDAALPTLS